MAQNITLCGADYSDVPSVELPKTGGGIASFTDVTDTTATEHDVASGKVFYSANGTLTVGDARVGESLVILKYGSSTWAEFISVYNTNSIVYCRASSNSNPASGLQTRLATMSYVNNETTPTEVEFQYYDSLVNHTNNQQGDQIYIYKLNSSGNWSFETRNTFTKIVAGNGVLSSYNNGELTLNSEIQIEYVV